MATLALSLKVARPAVDAEKREEKYREIAGESQHRSAGGSSLGHKSQICRYDYTECVSYANWTWALRNAAFVAVASVLKPTIPIAECGYLVMAWPIEELVTEPKESRREAAIVGKTQLDGGGKAADQEPLAANATGIGIQAEIGTGGGGGDWPGAGQTGLRLT